MKIGNDNEISFWLDNWCTHTSLFELTNTSPSSVDLKLKLFTFILPNKTWDISCLNQLLPNDIINLIKGIPLPHLDIKDSPVWGLTPYGSFTIKTVTWLLSHGLPPHPIKWQFSWIWKLDIPTKISIFLWQLEFMLSSTKRT